ncbi:MAG: tripartite tricarboxylate transporter substrate-binding protein, partial [Sulfuricaulis sp.]|nr:tripartite tricarboxylate transporter substrate-binding protein [Sulfuricaulis sp.]
MFCLEERSFFFSMVNFEQCVKGHAPAGAALLRGEVSLMFDAILLALPHIAAGKIKALGLEGF